MDPKARGVHLVTWFPDPRGEPRNTVGSVKICGRPRKAGPEGTKSTDAPPGSGLFGLFVRLFFFVKLRGIAEPQNLSTGVSLEDAVRPLRLQ